MWLTSVAIATVALVSCTAHPDDALSACGETSGTFTMTESRISGDCAERAPASYGASLTVGGGEWGFAVDGIGFCPATMDGCHIIATCQVGSINFVFGTEVFDMILSPAGLRGTAMMAICESGCEGYPPSLRTPCSGTFSVVGIRGG
jgi:hypothetical protein